MDNVELFVGAYQSKGLALKYNIIRYTSICLVLDYFCYINSITGDYATTLDNLIDIIFKQSRFCRSKYNTVIVKTTIINMIMMGLIVEQNGAVHITNGGKQAYIDQKFHIQCANLHEAQATRTLSRIAIIIAVTSLILTTLLSFI